MRALGIAAAVDEKWRVAKGANLLVTLYAIGPSLEVLDGFFRAHPLAVLNGVSGPTHGRLGCAFFIVAVLLLLLFLDGPVSDGEALTFFRRHLTPKLEAEGELQIGKELLWRRLRHGGDFNSKGP